MSTVSFAQEWDVDSRTRVNMHGDDGMMLTEQRATLGATWEGSDWGIKVSSDANYKFDSGTFGMNVYEANASVNLMDYANLTAGRQALNYGSGMIMSDNQFTSGTRNTWDGLRFDITAIEMADISIGYASANTGNPGLYNVTMSPVVLEDSMGLYLDVETGNENLYHAVEGSTTGLGAKGMNMFINVNKEEGDWKANFLYTSESKALGLSSDGVSSWSENATTSMMGIDLEYAMMGGDLNLDGSYNTQNINMTDGSEDYDGSMYSVGATYTVSEGMTIGANQTVAGEEAFSSDMGNRSGGYANTGNLGYLGDNEQDRNISASYTMGALSLTGTYHMITNTGEATGDEDYERNVMDISLGYSMSDNATLSLKYVSDDEASTSVDPTKMMWVTLNVRP